MAAILPPGLHGVVHLNDCRLAGLTRAAVRWQVESGRWQYVLPRVLATFSGPIPYSTLLAAAVLYAGAGAVLSHATAGHEFGLCPRPPAVHLTVPYGRAVSAHGSLVLHRSRTLGRQDVGPWSPPRTRVERTVIDMVDDAQSADAALALVAAAVRSRRTTAGRLREAIEGASGTRWRAVILDALPDVARGAHSPLELKDARMRRRHGLPMGRRQHRRCAEGVEYLDVLIEEYGLHVELDGRLGHDGARELWRDMRRDNRSTVAGLRHLRYGWADMVCRPCEVAIQQALVLRDLGWPGRFRPCQSCPRPLPQGL